MKTNTSPNPNATALNAIDQIISMIVFHLDLHKNHHQHMTKLLNIQNKIHDYNPNNEYACSYLTIQPTIYYIVYLCLLHLFKSKCT